MQTKERKVLFSPVQKKKSKGFCWGRERERASANKNMGKEGDLWDDSALINAFDTAISKYKVQSFALSLYIYLY